MLPTQIMPFHYVIEADANKPQLTWTRLDYEQASSLGLLLSGLGMSNTALPLPIATNFSPIIHPPTLTHMCQCQLPCLIDNTFLVLSRHRYTAKHTNKDLIGTTCEEHCESDLRNYHNFYTALFDVAVQIFDTHSLLDHPCCTDNISPIR